MLECFVFLIERIDLLHQAVGIADASRALCLSTEVKGTGGNEAVSDASQSEGERGSIFFHVMILMPIAVLAFVSPLRPTQLGAERHFRSATEDCKPVAIIPAG